MEAILRHHHGHNGTGQGPRLEKLREIFGRADSRGWFYGLLATILLLPSIATTLLLALLFSGNQLSPSGDGVAWIVASTGVAVAAILPFLIFALLIRITTRLIARTTWVQVGTVDAQLLEDSKKRRKAVLSKALPETEPRPSSDV